MFFEMISCSYRDVADSYHRPTSGGSAAADRSGRVRTFDHPRFPRARPLETETFCLCASKLRQPTYCSLGVRKGKRMTSHCPTGFETMKSFFCAVSSVSMVQHLLYTAQAGRLLDFAQIRYSHPHLYYYYFFHGPY